MNGTAIEQIRKEIDLRVGYSVQQLQVALQDGYLVITGFARNYHQKQLAQEEALKHSSSIVNNITVPT